VPRMSVLQAEEEGTVAQWTGTLLERPLS